MKQYIVQLKGETLEQAYKEYDGAFFNTKTDALNNALDGGYKLSDIKKIVEINFKFLSVKRKNK